MFSINLTLLTEFVLLPKPRRLLNVTHNITCYFSTPTQSHSARSPQALIPVLIADKTMAPKPPFNFPRWTPPSHYFLFKNAERTQMRGIITAAHQRRLFLCNSILQRKEKPSSQKYSMGVSRRLHICGTGHTGDTGGTRIASWFKKGTCQKGKWKCSRNWDLCDVTKGGSNWRTHSVAFSLDKSTHTGLISTLKLSYCKHKTISAAEEQS